MNEEISSTVLPDQGDILAAEDPAAALDPAPETVIAEVVQERPFLTTPLDDYTVTEGLLLLILLILVIDRCIRIVKGGFSWLF